MRKRLPHSNVIVSMALALARKTIQQHGESVECRNIRGRQYIVRGEQACIVRNARSWRVSS